MISIPELRPQLPMHGEGFISTSREECCRQITVAERELNAFLKAVQALYGDSAAARAAHDWIALAASIQVPLVQGLPSWRSVTILASSRLAMGHFGYMPRFDQRGSDSDTE